MSRIKPPKQMMPMPGEKPTGIFSTRGSQKKDPITSAYKKWTGNNYDDKRVKPKSRSSK